MNEQIQEIAQRMRGLREAIKVTPEEMAKVCRVSIEKYMEYESGGNDIPVSALENISKKYKVELSALLFGAEPRMKSFYLTRAGQGTAMERTKVYKYQALASGFVGRLANPFIVTVAPYKEDDPTHLNIHDGQEFNYVLEGRMRLSIDGYDLELSEGDSIYFNAGLPHGMRALGSKPVKFLAIIF